MYIDAIETMLYKKNDYCNCRKLSFYNISVVCLKNHEKNTLFSASVAESVKLIIDDDSENLADTRYIKVKVN